MSSMSSIAGSVLGWLPAPSAESAPVLEPRRSCTAHDGAGRHSSSCFWMFDHAGWSCESAAAPSDRY